MFLILCTQIWVWKTSNQKLQYLILKTWLCLRSLEFLHILAECHLILCFGEISTTTGTLISPWNSTSRTGKWRVFFQNHSKVTSDTFVLCNNNKYLSNRLNIHHLCLYFSLQILCKLTNTYFDIIYTTLKYFSNQYSRN